MPKVHLDGNGAHRPRWYGSDPRHKTWALTWGIDTRTGEPLHQRLYHSHEAAKEGKTRLSAHDQVTAKINRWEDEYGVEEALERWVRVLAEELPEWPDLTEHATVRSECAVLLEHWSWICDQAWAVELADDITKITAQVRAQLGQRPEYRPRCRKCSSIVIPVDAERRLTSWEACAYGACTGCDWTYPTGPALAALGQSQEPMPLRDIAPVIGLPLRTLQRWVTDGLITPANDKRRGRVFDLATVRAVANVKFRRKVDDRAG